MKLTYQLENGMLPLCREEQNLTRFLKELAIDMIAFLDEMPQTITEYSEVITRRLIDRITIFDEKIVVEMKSRLQIEVEE